MVRRFATASSWPSTWASGRAPSSTRTRAPCWATTAGSGSTPSGSARGCAAELPRQKRTQLYGVRLWHLVRHKCPSIHHS